MPILKQIDEGILVIVSYQPRIQSIEFITHDMMKGHAGVLGRALDKPIQRVPFLNLKPVVTHALGGGIGRVLGQAGLKGSGPGFG
jgi:hypothetical protein